MEIQMTALPLTKANLEDGPSMNRHSWLDVVHSWIKLTSLDQAGKAWTKLQAFPSVKNRDCMFLGQAGSKEEEGRSPAECSRVSPTLANQTPSLCLSYWRSFHTETRGNQGVP